MTCIFGHVTEYVNRSLRYVKATDCLKTWSYLSSLLGGKIKQPYFFPQIDGRFAQIYEKATPHRSPYSPPLEGWREATGWQPRKQVRRSLAAYTVESYSGLKSSMTGFVRVSVVG